MSILKATLLMALSFTKLGADTNDESLVKEILPSAEESAWQSINWQTDLWAARKEAVKLGKPIYLWEMDGHPLGCV